ncbi:MAG: 4-hydroxyphenylpyruvate dioxygenase [Leptolyngbyaceae cyanobacterium bins.59]|nr:4-hydroxyphenylpyruvate dioxygenase [Leptolyngbyaceae cyanobacterium bins.59]
MKIDHVHFYVEDAVGTRDWFREKLGFQALFGGLNHHTRLEVVCQGDIIFVLSSPLTAYSPVAQFLAKHPPGVVDVALAVDNLADLVDHATKLAPTLITPLQWDHQAEGNLAWSCLSAWGSLRHTLIERTGETSLLPPTYTPGMRLTPNPSALGTQERSLDVSSFLTRLDHVVLNVEAGQLKAATQWYQEILGFRPGQTFDIQTAWSGLHSQVMEYPGSSVQIPINEPTSPTSQIQEFLNLNGGPGVQHIALQTPDLVKTVNLLRQWGVCLLSVPMTYYTELRKRPGFPLSEEKQQAIAAQQILVDWQPESYPAVLFQTFTQPIFREPTFFFELIERQAIALDQQVKQANGFGEGNFRALFEAIEREQRQRGTL